MAEKGTRRVQASGANAGQRNSVIPATTSGSSSEANLLSEYEIGARLGEGGYGSVFLATSKRTGERYAMKKALVPGESARHDFLAEIEAWMNVPSYPHIAECHFFKVVGDSVFIFAELAENGSLADRILSGHLYDGGPEAALSRILLAAAQSAWGLHCAHEFRLVHQDVKPSNLLFGDADLMKVSDFGSTQKERPNPQTEDLLDYLIQDLKDPSVRARVLVPMREQLQAVDKHEVEGKGSFTAQYASPEQLRGEVLSPATDVWSWGISILEAFAGGCNWDLGTEAPQVLAALANRSSTHDYPAIPARIAMMLGRCFASDPTARWQALSDAANEVVLAWKEAVKTSFPLRMPPLPLRRKSVLSRQLPSGSNWDDPREWLAFAYSQTNGDQQEARRHWPNRTGSVVSQGVSDLQGFEHALQILQSSQLSERVESKSALWRLHHSVGNLCAFLGDTQRAFEHYDAAAELLMASAHAADRFCLAHVWNSKAILLRTCGQISDSMVLCDRAIEMLERQPSGEGASAMALLFATKANAVAKSDLAAGALLCQKAVDLEKDDASRATYLSSLASMLVGAGREGAEQALETAQALLSDLIQTSHRLDLQPKMALLLFNRAIFAQQRGDWRAALDALDDCIRRLTPLVDEEGQLDLADELGSAYYNRALALEGMGQVNDALASYALARERLSDIVLRKGRSEFVDSLAKTLRNEANLTRELGDVAKALRLAENGADLMTRLVREEGSSLWTGALAHVKSVLGSCLLAAGQTQDAVAVSCEAVELLRSAPPDTHPELSPPLAIGLLEYAVALRASGDAQGAWDRYQEALALLEGRTDADSLSAKGLILVNSANVLDDAGDFAQSLRLIDEAVELWEHLAQRFGPGFQTTECILAQKARTNELMKIGAYVEACKSADETLPLLEKLINEHRRGDLLAEYGKLWGTRAILAKKIGDLEGAIRSFERSAEIFESAPDHKNALSKAPPIPDYMRAQANELRQLSTLQPKDFSPWAARAEESLQAATQMSRACDTFHACELLDDALLIYAVLDEKEPKEKWLAALAKTYMSKGIIAMHSHRDCAAESAFRSAMDGYDALLHRTGRSEKLAEWGNAALGLCVFLETGGRREEREAVETQAANRLKKLGKSVYKEWRTKLEKMLEQL